MNNINEVFTTLFKKNKKQYLLFSASCFFSTLFITAYICLMLSPTVLETLPEGGDSRRQMMMIFYLAAFGCAAFIIYAIRLFLRYKSKELGIFLAMGTEREILDRRIKSELISLCVPFCIIGAMLGIVLSVGIWQMFKLLVTNSEELQFTISPQTFLYSLAFIIFVILSIVVIVGRFVKNNNIMDTMYQTRKTESVKEVPNSYRLVGILLLAIGLAAGYLLPALIIDVLHVYPPSIITLIAYLPALLGLYMLLLHTIQRREKSDKKRYQTIISDSMMKFQSRQTVQNMLIVTLLIAGGYFASFYVPNMAGSALVNFSRSQIDYSFYYKADQNMINEEEIRTLADTHHVEITDYNLVENVLLGIDGHTYQMTGDNSFDIVYDELSRTEPFLSESTYNILTGSSVDVKGGEILAVYNDDGSHQNMTSKDVTVVTNTVTGKTLNVTPRDDVIKNSVLFGTKILDDEDYAKITKGATSQWKENRVFFNVNEVEQSYKFATALYCEIVNRSSTDSLVDNFFDPIVKMKTEKEGKPYCLGREYQETQGDELLDIVDKDTSIFRLNWKYMPDFQILKQMDYITIYAVYLILFVLIAIICFSTAIMILYIRSITIAMNNAEVYRDLKKLGASNEFVSSSIRKQISKIFKLPIIIGTIAIYSYYAIVLYFNDRNFVSGELLGMAISTGVISVMSLILYGVYRFTYRKISNNLKV